MANATRARYLIDAERRLLVEANPAGLLLWGLGASQELPLALDGAMPAMAVLCDVARGHVPERSSDAISQSLTFWTRRGAMRWRCKVAPVAKRPGVLEVVPDIVAPEEAAGSSFGPNHALGAGSNGMGVLAHEVRTPLAAIQAFADLMLMTPAGEGADQRLREHAGNIRQAAAMGLEIVSSILERDGSSPEPSIGSSRSASLDAVARTVLATMAPLTGQAGASITCAVPNGLPPARVDATALAQIVMNLVGNALRHAGPKPTIAIRAGKANGNRIWIEVEDDGPGIPDTVSEAVMTRGAARKGQLAGFGLRTSVMLARENGGELSIQSVSPHGARVRVSFHQIPQPAARKVLVSEPI